MKHKLTLLLFALVAGPLFGQNPETALLGHRDLPGQYWANLVTEQPEGYVVDANGDVHLYTKEALAWLISLTNGLNGQEVEDFAGKTITLEADVDLSGALWQPIAGKNPIVGFKGNFNGNGHVVEGVTMTEGAAQYNAMGFFGKVSGAAITDMVLKNGYYEAHNTGNDVGGFLANHVHKSILDRCFVECEMYIAGEMSPFVYLCDSSTISNCLVYSPLICSPFSYGELPGIFVAMSWSTSHILNCASIIERMDWSEFCGLVGMFNYGSIENSYAFIGEVLDYSMYVPGPGPRNGITSGNMGEIRNCYFNRIRDPYYPSTPYYYLDLDDSPGEGGIIEDTHPFVEEGRGRWKLTEAVSFGLGSGTVTTDDLLDALNYRVDLLDDPTLLRWCDTVMGFDNQRLPVFCGLSVTETVENETEKDLVDLQPNPTDGLVTIMGNDLESAEVYNALGQRVATVKGQGEQLTVSLEGLPSGIYFINVTDTEGRKCVKKVVKK